MRNVYQGGKNVTFPHRKSNFKIRLFSLCLKTVWTGAFLPLLPTCQAISYLGNFSSTTLVITTTERTVFKGRFGWLESPPSSQDCNFTWETFSHKSALERQTFSFSPPFALFSPFPFVIIKRKVLEMPPCQN